MCPCSNACYLGSTKPLKEFVDFNMDYEYAAQILMGQGNFLYTIKAAALKIICNLGILIILELNGITKTGIMCFSLYKPCKIQKARHFHPLLLSSLCSPPQPSLSVHRPPCVVAGVGPMYQSLPLGRETFSGRPCWW